MKNKEMFAREIADIAIKGDHGRIAVNKTTGEPVACYGFDCHKCLFWNCNDDDCNDCLLKWAEAEYKEPITRDRLAREYGIFVAVDNISATKYHYSNCFEWLLDNYNVTEKEAEND